MLVIGHCMVGLQGEKDYPLNANIVRKMDWSVIKYIGQIPTTNIKEILKIGLDYVHLAIKNMTRKIISRK
jgi:hypothetical protein